MSSGLTYVAIYDGALGAPETSSGPVQFQLYDEAYEWARWYVDFIQDQNTFVLLKSFGPNSSGYWRWLSGTSSFTLYD